MHCRRDQRGLVAAALREIFNAESYEHARERVTSVFERLKDVAPKVCELLEEAEEDLLAFYRFPGALEQAALNESLGAGQQGDRPPHRRRRDLPQRRRRDPARRRTPKRTE